MIKVSQYQEGIIRLPIYDATSLTNGQALIWGVDGAGLCRNSLIDAVAALPVDIFAVLGETPATTTTNHATPIVYQAGVQMVSNAPIWKIYQDLSTSTDLDVTSSTSTTLTHTTDDDPLDGCWIYINSGTGVGQLRYNTTGTATTKVVNTAFTTTPDSTSDYILIRNYGLNTGGQDLNSTFDKLVSVLTATGEILILKNFIQSPMTGDIEMDITKNGHIEGDGYNLRGVRFYSHIIFLDRALSTPSVTN